MTVDKPGFSMYNSRIVCSDKMHKAKREGIVFHGFREEMESMTKLKRVLCGTLSALMLVSMPLISGCSTPEIAMTVDGREFTTGEYLAYLLHTFQQMDRSYYLSYYAAQGVDIWSQTFTYGEGDDAQKLKLSDYIKQVAQDTIIRQIVLKREMEANNLSPREEDREVMKEDTAGLTNDILLAYGINKEHYMAMAEAVYTYERGLFFGLFDKGGPQEMSEEDILKYFNDYYLSYKIIELSLTEDGKDMDDEAKQEQLDKLEKYLKLYETEKDFDKVLAQYKEDINPPPPEPVRVLLPPPRLPPPLPPPIPLEPEPARAPPAQERERAPEMRTRKKRKTPIPTGMISTPTCTATRISPTRSSR